MYVQVRGYQFEGRDTSISLIPESVSVEEKEVNKLTKDKTALMNELRALENTIQANKLAKGSNMRSLSNTKYAIRIYTFIEPH